MAIDFAPLWNFNKPEVSEQRFRVALETATGDDALVLQTQIARTYGLRKDFSKAQEILKSIAKDELARLLLANEIGLLNGEQVITWKQHAGKQALDSKRLRADLPDVYESFLKIGDPFRVMRAK